MRDLLFGRPLSTRGERDRELHAVGAELDRALRGVHNAVLTGLSANDSALAQARQQRQNLVLEVHERHLAVKLHHNPVALPVGQGRHASRVARRVRCGLRLEM